MIPWRSFHSEMALVAATLPVALWAPLRKRVPQQVPWIALVLCAFALVPWAQFFVGKLEYVGDAWLPACYFIAFGLAIATGARFEQVEPGRLAPVLFGAYVLAALVSTGLALYQLLHVTGLGLLTMEFPYARGARPFGNLGQSNHLATLLVWGLVALWWLFLKGHLRGSVVVAAAAFVLFGIASTQSRTAWVELTLLAAAAGLWRDPLAGRRVLPGFVALGLYFTVLVAGWSWFAHSVEFNNVRTVSGELATAGLRPSIYRLFADAVAREPWAGWGWNQISVAHHALALDHPALGYSFTSAHNGLLDLAVQQGIPLTLLLAGALLVWYVGALRRVRTDTDALLAVAITVLLAHAMVEFPQNYTYFLVPLGLMMGLLHAHEGTRGTLQVSRWGVFALAVASTVVCLWMTVEYRTAEKSLETVRMERNRVGYSRGSKAPDLVMLTQLREFLAYLRIRYTQPAPPAQLEAMRRLVARYPSDGNFLVLAVAEVTNGRPDLAADALARLCRMVPASRCEGALDTWKAIAADKPEFAKVALPR